MKLSELIKRLQEIENYVGDMDCIVSQYAGDNGNLILTETENIIASNYLILSKDVHDAPYDNEVLVLFYDGLDTDDRNVQYLEPYLNSIQLKDTKNFDSTFDLNEISDNEVTYKKIVYGDIEGNIFQNLNDYIIENYNISKEKNKEQSE